MKSLQESLLDDEDILMQETGKKTLIKKFIKDNYHINKNKSIKISDDFVVDATGDVYLQDWANALTNDMFTWGRIKGDFICNDCLELTSLKGGPKKVDGCFEVSGCVSLESLEGAPEECILFDCSDCDSLKSLKGAPKKVTGTFFCKNCKAKFKESDVKKYSDVKENIYC